VSSRRRRPRPTRRSLTPNAKPASAAAGRRRATGGRNSTPTSAPTSPPAERLPIRPPLIVLAGVLAVVVSGCGAGMGASTAGGVASGQHAGAAVAASVVAALVGTVAGAVARRYHDLRTLSRLDTLLSDALAPPAPPHGGDGGPPTTSGTDLAPRGPDAFPEPEDAGPGSGSTPRNRPASRPLAAILATPRAAAPTRRRRAPVAAPRPPVVVVSEPPRPGALLPPPSGPGVTAALIERHAVDIAGLSPRSSPPPAMTAAQGGALRLQAVMVDQIVAGWLALVADGVLRVDETRKGHLALEPGDPERAAGGWPRAAAAHVFDRRGHVRLYGYDRRIVEASRWLGDDLSAWLASRRGPWGPLPWAYRSSVYTVAAAVVGLAWAALSGATGAPLLGGGLVGVAVVALVIGGALGVASGGPTLQLATPAGYAAWVPLEAYRRWLADAGRAEVSAVARDGRLAEATTWAVALGCRDAWHRAVRTAAPGLDPDQREAALLALRLARQLDVLFWPSPWHGAGPSGS
jgi:Predicted membrane protein (DUF2207)